MITFKKTVQNTNFTKEEEVQELIDHYKELFLELKQQISNLRKETKNPIIPDAMSRNIPSKIQFAEFSKSKEDCESIEKQLKEVQEEIEHCKGEVIINLQKEIEEEYEAESSKEVSDGAVQTKEEGRRTEA